MQKIDLHIHTIQSVSDSPFSYSIEKLKEYVDRCRISCIAITNHNLFDLSQYKEIAEALSIIVFPGIEINLENGHLLLISDNSELEDFDLKCQEITKKIRTKDDTISLIDFMSIFGDLSRYLLIPHYQKNPSINDDIISKLGSMVTAGEVSSPKKFVYCIRDNKSLVPVLFSDIRIDENLTNFPTRQTYFDIGEISLNALRLALRDKDKVFLSKERCHEHFEILDIGVKLSTGLNVILGERSTGKTYMLNRIAEKYENIKYLRQFELLEKNEEEDLRRFNGVISQRQSLFTQNYLKELKSVVDDLASVNIENDIRDVEKYLSSLLKNAQESERADSFSKAMLFNETLFHENDLTSLKIVINALETIIDNQEYKEIINKYISENSIKLLAIDLMKMCRQKHELNIKMRWTNDLVNTINKLLQVHTAATRIEDIDLYKIAKDKLKIKKFSSLVNSLKNEKEIINSEFQGFKVIAKARKFINATEMKNISGKKLSFSSAFNTYENAYEFLKELREINGLEEADFYKFFIAIDYQVLNKYGFPVSGGERSEFRLLQEISDAQQYEMLLIDEPESSFDNLFLKNEVNQIIKAISKSMPVVIVTHNNTVGASIKPNYLLYTSKKINDDGTVKYEIYGGHPTDKYLVGQDGHKIQNFEIMLNCLEAGDDAYQERGASYEILKDTRK